jgi:sec-independent protein translocase protein TatC
MSTSKGEMPFLEHLEELRRRILWSFLAIAVGSAVGIYAVLQLDVIDLLTLPLEAAIADVSAGRPELGLVAGSGRLVFLDLTEPFFFAIKVGVAAGLVLASPVVVYHLWSFLAPALEQREKRVIVPSLYLGLVLFAAGVALAYTVALPVTIRFLLAFGMEWFTPSLTADHYLGMVWRLLVTFGLVFELPVLVMILSALGLVTPAFLRSKRRHAIVVMVVVASLLSPGDLVSLTVLLLGPLIVLYEGSILLSSLVRRERVEGVSLIVPLILIYEMRERLATALDRRRGHEAARI